LKKRGYKTKIDGFKRGFRVGLWDIISDTLCYNIKRLLSYWGTDKKNILKKGGLL